MNPTTKSELSSAALAAVWVASALLFLAIQGAMALRNSDFLAHASTSGFFGGVTRESSAHRLIVAISLNIVEFIGFTVCAVFLARRGYRWLWATPLVVLVAGPALRIVAGPGLHPIGTEWVPPCISGCGDPAAPLLVASAIDLALILAAGAWTATRSEAIEHVPRDGIGVAVVLFTMTLAFLIYRAGSVLSVAPDVSVFASVVLFSFLFGSRTRQWPWVPTLYVLVASGVIAQQLHALGLREVSRFSSLPMTWATLAVLLIVSTAVSLADRASLAVTKMAARPKLLLMAAISLNALDAMMTWYSVRAGSSLELNPVVKATGLPMKVVGVTAICYVIYRYAPRALIWPIVVLAGVCAYHLTGLFIN